MINFNPLESFLFAYTSNYNFNNKTLFSRNRQEFTHFISIPLNAKSLQDAFLEFKMVSLPIVNILNIIIVMILWAVFRGHFCHLKKVLVLLGSADSLPICEWTYKSAVTKLKFYVALKSTDVRYLKVRVGRFVRFLAKLGLLEDVKKPTGIPQASTLFHCFISSPTATSCLQSVNDSQFNLLGRLARMRRNSGPGRIDFSTTVAPSSNHLHPGPNG